MVGYRALADCARTWLRITALPRSSGSAGSCGEQHQQLVAATKLAAQPPLQSTSEHIHSVIVSESSHF